MVSHEREHLVKARNSAGSRERERERGGMESSWGHIRGWKGWGKTMEQKEKCFAVVSLYNVEPSPHTQFVAKISFWIQSPLEFSSANNCREKVARSEAMSCPLWRFGMHSCSTRGAMLIGYLIRPTAFLYKSYLPRNVSCSFSHYIFHFPKACRMRSKFLFSLLVEHCGFDFNALP